jgi:hypothetical protein
MFHTVIRLSVSRMGKVRADVEACASCLQVAEMKVTKTTAAIKSTDLLPLSANLRASPWVACAGRHPDRDDSEAEQSWHHLVCRAARLLRYEKLTSYAPSSLGLLAGGESRNSWIDLIPSVLTWRVSLHSILTIQSSA